MELKQYLVLIRRWWWLIVLTALVGGIGAFVASQFQEPVYEASTTVLINQAPGSLPEADAVISGQRVAATYAELLHQRPVLEEVITKLSLDVDHESLERNVSVLPVRDTNLLVLTVRDSDPQQAADIANEIVRVFIEQNLEFQASRYAASVDNLQTELAKVQADMERTQDALDALEGATSPEQVTERNRLQVLMSEYRSTYATLLNSYEQVRLAEAQTTDKVSIIESALPGKKAGYSSFISMLLGGLVGTMLAFGTVLLIEYLRETVNSSEDVAALIGAPTLGIIGHIQTNAPIDVLVTATKPRSPIAEAYRVLRSNLDFSAVDDPIRTIVITSCGPVEGKTTTSANLAVAFAQFGKRVILVDADLRRPTLHKLFQQNNNRGVTTALFQASGVTASDHLVPTGVSNLYLMPSGPLPPNPADLLGSRRMVVLIEELSSHADVVLFDSPPILAVADSALLARSCDATVLVVLANATRGGALREVKEQIERSGAHLLGVVLNKVSSSSDGYYYRYGYYSQQ